VIKCSALFIQVGLESESCGTDGGVMLIDPSEGQETLTEYDFPDNYVNKQILSTTFQQLSRLSRIISTTGLGRRLTD
jgi:hypothetical protein